MMKTKHKSWDWVDGKLVQVEQDIQVAKTHEQLVKEQIDSLRLQQFEIVSELNKLDVKKMKYDEQLELVTEGLLESTDLNRDEYIELLQAKQIYRVQHRDIAQQIYDLENPVINTEEATTYEQQ